MSATLLDGHDVVLFDLDGTVYRGGELVSGALEAVGEVLHCGEERKAPKLRQRAPAYRRTEAQ